MKKIKLAVFISGRGSNMNVLIEACKAPDFPAEIILVLSNKTEAQGLETARKNNIQTAILSHKGLTREAFEGKILETLEKYPIDLICLAGFMRVLTSGFVEKWAGRMINIHPSLLPNYKGLDTHARAIADGKREAGCTVHYVVPDVDSGEIIVQKTVPVMPDDTPESLAARVLEQEHVAYLEAVRIVAKKMLGE